ncbi:MAG TPA: class I SAM-dependent methyltransferase [Baekduia sp.]|uniref:class I SAM-dependent methyltransferase n=1 Tax=Baekduia sp. TaxID=2600305 RepID=UPI002B872341|nr:class I SAM-dependent methyltransferase [Baekduia sp.]HMJ35722.1 class I SAM-dependent methyltransferase [Baekduia sp.]
MTDSTIDAPAVFDAAAADYDAPRRRLIPPFEMFYGTAVAALEMLGRPPARVLDLGAGTGMLAARVGAAHPEAELVLVDGAPAMLDQARAALGDRAQLHVADLADPLPPGPFDAVVSALAIHHLDDAGKQALFARVCAALPPGGVFVNAEQVAGPRPCFDARYRAWHEASARALGATADEWAAAAERMRHDRCSDVESQLRWLREAGFDAADCLFKDHCFAVLVARRKL